MLHLSKQVLIIAGVCVLSAACAFGEIKPKAFEPEPDSVSSRPVRGLRVFFNVTPDVENSSLSLTGPSGELEVTGLHTMGADDLMARVVGQMPDGDYTAKWTVAADGEKAEGEWSFSIKRGGAEQSAAKRSAAGSSAASEELASQNAVQSASSED